MMETQVTTVLGIEQVIARESERLLAFIRQRAPEDEAEDILQDVFTQLSTTGIDSIDHLSSWLFTVARNRITDLYRKRKPESFSRWEARRSKSSNEALYLADILPDLTDGPEQDMLRATIMEELEEAIDDLPESQRIVFMMHEFEDKSFKEIAAETGVEVPTLLSRKRYAVNKLRQRLRALYEELISE